MTTKRVQTGLQYIGVIVLVLFAFSGALKWLPFPVDTTVLSAGILLLIVGMYSIHLRGRIDVNALAVAGLVLGFLVVYSFTSIYTASGVFYLQKLQGIILDALAFICAFILVRTNGAARTYCITMLGIASISAGAVLYMQSRGQLEYLVQLGVNRELLGFPDYLVLGKLIGIGAIVVLGNKRIWAMIAGLVLIIAIVLLGARGPAIFACVACLVLFWVNRGKMPRNDKIWATLLGTLGLGVAIYIGTDQLFTEIESDRLLRFSAIFSDPHSIRGEVFEDAFSVIADYPLLGSGIGGYGTVGYHLDENIYPHNLFLEAMAESGVFGFSIFAIGVTAIFLYGFRNIRSTERAIAAGLLIFLFLNYMKTGSFIGARDLYMHFGVVLALSSGARAKDSGIPQVSRQRKVLSF